jgi:DeoR/GlpR family transcriptional regulator of sugar metabolism
MMILARIESHLRERKRASLTDLAETLDTNPEALRGMLDVLIRKGRIQRLPSGTACGGGCSKCKPETVELFEAVNDNSS